MEAAPNADNDANAVVFNLGASVIRMDMKNLESNELKPELEMTSWLRMSWMDFRLKWNPEVFSVSTYIFAIFWKRKIMQLSLLGLRRHFANPSAGQQGLDS